MNWLLIAAGFILIWRIAEGFHRGMVKEIISCVSLVVLCLAVLLLGTALRQYMEKDMISMAVAIILLLVLCIAHRLLSLVFFSAKLIAKLPVVNLLDKAAGAVIGVAETVLLLWTVYFLVMTFGRGVIKEQILQYVSSSEILRFFYKYNYLKHWVDVLAQYLNIVKIDF